MSNFFIFDCNGNIVGNPKGYPTIKGAIAQERKFGSKAYNAIAKAYLERESSEIQNLEEGIVVAIRKNLSSIRRISA